MHGAYYPTPYVPLLAFPAIPTPYQRPGVIPPRPYSPPPSPDQSNASEPVSAYYPWYLPAPVPLAQSAGENAISTPHPRNGFGPPPLVDAAPIYPEPSEAAAAMPNVDAWVPHRTPDIVEWENVRGGRLFWTPHARSDTALFSSRPVTPAPLPSPEPAPAVPPPVVPVQAQARQRTPARAAVNLPAAAPAPVFQWTPSAPFAWLPYTPAHVIVPLATQPPPVAQRPSLSPYLRPAQHYPSPTIWDVATTPPKLGSLRYHTQRGNIAALSEEVLKLPATSPPAHALRVRFSGHHLSRWGFLYINDSSSTESVITVGEFLGKIWAHLQTLVTEKEWKAVSQAEKNAVTRAMERRCRRGSGLRDYVWYQGVRRVDFLVDGTMFAGATPVPIAVPSADRGGHGWMYEVEVSLSS